MADNLHNGANPSSPTPLSVSRALAWLRYDRRRLAVAALLLACIVVRAALPWLLEWSIEWQGTKQLGRVVEVGDVDLALVTGGIVIEALAVGPIFDGDEPPPLDPEEAHFRSDRIEARWSWLALFRRELHLEALEFAAPDLLAVRAADGRLVPVLRPQEVAVPDGTEADPSESAWSLRLDELRLNDFRLLYVNLMTAGLRPLELEMEEFSLDDLTLRGSEVALGALGLRGPRLRLRKDIDLDPFAATAPEEEPQTAPALQRDATPRSVRIAEVALERAAFQLVLADREIETHLSLRAQEISAEVGSRFPLELRLDLEGGWLELEGEVGAAPPAFKGTLTWADLPLEALAAAAELPVRVSSGVSSGALEIHALLTGGTESEASHVDVSGRVGIEQFDAAAPDDSVAVKWSLFELELAALSLRPDGEEGRPLPPVVELAAVRLRDPVLRVTRRTGSTATDPAAADEPIAPQAEPAPEASPAPRVVVDLLELSGGAAEFVDETLSPIHRSRIRKLTLHGRDLRWPERDAREFKLAARGPGTTRFGLDASLRAGNGRVKLDLEELGLAQFSAYAAEAAGYTIEDGKASFRAEVEVTGERYDIESDLALHRLDVAELKRGSFGQAFGVPLDLALALLRDPSGKIGIPIAAKLEGGRSEVAVASVAASALRQALVGAVTAPLKGLGLLMGSGNGGGETGLRLEPLRADPGTRAPHLASLPELAEVLDTRPGLGLKLSGRVGAADEPALAERMLTAQVVADAELPPVDAGFLQKRRLRGALEDRARNERKDLGSDDAEALARWISAVDVTDDERAALAHDRATALRNALMEQHDIAAERIELGEPLQGEPGVVVEFVPLAP